MERKHFIRCILAIALAIMSIQMASAQVTLSHAGGDINYSMDSRATSSPVQPPEDTNFSFPDENSIIDISARFPALSISQEIKDLNADANGDKVAFYGERKSAFSSAKQDGPVFTEGFGANVKFCSNQPTGTYCEDWARNCNEVSSIGSYQSIWIYREQHGVVHKGNFQTYDYDNFIDATDPTGYDVTWGSNGQDELQYNYKGDSPYYEGWAYKCTTESINLYDSAGLWDIELGLYDNKTGEYDGHTRQIAINQSRAYSIVANGSSRTKDSYKCNETIETTHQFTNNGANSVGYNADYEIYDPEGHRIQTGSASGTLNSRSTFTGRVTSPAPSGGWPDNGYYKIRAHMLASVGNNAYEDQYSYTTAYVPAAPCIEGNIELINEAPTKSAYACNENLVSTHEFKNTGSYDYSYNAYYELYDPSGTKISNTGMVTDQTLPAGESRSWAITSHTSDFGNWAKSGNYKHKVWLWGPLSNGKNKTSDISEVNLNVPTACIPGEINSYDGTPDKESYGKDDTIISNDHKFENTSNLYKFNYLFYYELKDPNGNVVYSGSNTDGTKTLNPLKYENWELTLPPPSGGWPIEGTYTLKTWVSGKFEDNREKTAYSMSYPYVPVVIKACEAKSNSAWVEQDGKCNEQIIVKHQFDNTGTRTFLHNANFYLYDQSNNRIKTTSNSYSIDPGRGELWTVKWGAPVDGWKPGTYRSEAYVDGTCTGGGTSSASNSVTASIPQSCGNTTCAGTINVSVNDGASNPVPDAKAYIASSYSASTDSGGSAEIPVSDSTCGRSHSIKIYCSNGTYCDTKSTSIGSNGGSANLSFSCSVCARAQNLSVSATTNKESYNLNETIRLDTTVRSGGNNIDAASLSIYDPFTGETIRASTSGNGTSTYNTTASKTGLQTFTISASKGGYNSTSMTKSVAVNQEMATIYVSVANNDGTQMEGATLYIDSAYGGETDTSDKKTLSTTAGNHIIEAKCPTLEYCGSKSDYFSGQKNISFKCNCDIDADGDGLSASEEEIIGSDPYNANSNLYSNLGSVKLHSCNNPLAIFWPFTSNDDRAMLKSNLKAMDYSQLSDLANGKTAAIAAAAQGTKVLPAAITSRNTSYRALFSVYTKQEAFSSKDGTVIIMATRPDGSMSIVSVPANCSGMFFGIIGGVLGGLKSDVDFAAQVLQGIWWTVSHPKEIAAAIGNSPEAPGKIVAFFTSVDFSGLFGQAGSAMHTITMDIMREGNKYNVFKFDKTAHAAYQVGFLEGYVTGYVGEQVLLLGKIADIIKGIKIVGETGKTIGKAFEAFMRIGQEFGSKTAEILQKFSVNVFEWGSKPAQNFAARLTKIFPNTADADKWIASLGPRAEEVLDKGERVTQKLAAEIEQKLKPELGEEAAKKAAQEAANSTMSKLMNSKYGREAMETFEEGPLQQLAEVYQKHDSVVVERFGQNLENKGYSLKEAMAYADDIKSIPGTENLRTKAVTSNNLGHFFNMKRASQLKKQGNVILREAGTEEPIVFNWRGKTIPNENLDKDILYDLSSNGETKRILEEVKSKSSGDGGVIRLDNEGEKQLYKIAQAIKNKVADEARLVSPSGQVFDNNYKRVAEQLGITILEGVI